jgi:hypothetical protein
MVKGKRSSEVGPGVNGPLYHCTRLMRKPFDCPLANHSPSASRPPGYNLSGGEKWGKKVRRNHDAFFRELPILSLSWGKGWLWTSGYVRTPRVIDQSCRESNLSRRIMRSLSPAARRDCSWEANLLSGFDGRTYYHTGVTGRKISSIKGSHPTTEGQNKSDRGQGNVNLIDIPNNSVLTPSTPLQCFSTFFLEY